MKPVDPILETVLGTNQVSEPALCPSEPTGILDQLRCRSLYNVDSPRVDAAPIPAAKKKAITEVEKDLKALGKRTGQDFRRTLARHANVLRAEVKNLVHQHKDEIIAHVKDADSEK